MIWKTRSVTLTYPQSVGNSLNIKAAFNAPNLVYRNGENMEITLEASQTCYFKVYYLNAHGSMSLIYPNKENGSPQDWNNRLEANRARTVPEGMLHYKLSYPFGEESILIVASKQELPVSENEMATIVYVTDTVVDQITRGVTLTAIANVGKSTAISASHDTVSIPTVSWRYTYKIIP
ncbi:MAG: DUF4384 domain-containing protein [Treponema sp.]|nr:DUF4384 domain-containing protein [Treponema sp.]